MDYDSDNHDGFYREALNLFVEACLTDTSEPVFYNHTVDQLLFYDCQYTVFFPKAQRSALNQLVHNVSFLFEISEDAFDYNRNEKIRFFCAEISCEKSMRSQMACYVHSRLLPVLDCDASIFLFKHNNSIMISMTGYNQICILSDWYDVDDCSDFVDKLCISNFRLKTAKKFFFDFIDSVAREYYTHPISKEAAMYTTLPDDYLVVNPNMKFGREELKEIVEEALMYYVYKYGDDYVFGYRLDGEVAAIGEQKIDFDIDMMLLSLNSDIEDINEGFEEANVDEELEEGDNDSSNDEVDFSDIDPKIMKDPIKMVKWLEKQSFNEP